MFGYDDAIVGEYPAIRAGIIHATSVVNGASSAGLLDEYRAEQRAAAGRSAGRPIAEWPSIAAWRRAFRQFGAKPTQHRCAAEALLRRLSKHGDIPSVNALVDIGNLVSIRYALPVAVFDRVGIAGSVTVRFAAGGEQFTDLGASDNVHPNPGEVIFADDDDVVSARRWCWRQSAQSATNASTTDALIVIEGLHETAEQDVESATSDLFSLLAIHQPSSETKSRQLSSANPVF